MHRLVAKLFGFQLLPTHADLSRQPPCRHRALPRHGVDGARQSTGSGGRDIIHMEVGEPDFPTPEPIVAAAQAHIASGRVFYTPALGLPELRGDRRLLCHTLRHHIPASRIVVTAGASGACCWRWPASPNRAANGCSTDPGYPCNRNFVRSFEGLPVGIPVRAENNFQPTLAEVEAHWNERTAGACSPRRPTPPAPCSMTQRWPPSPAFPSGKGRTTDRRRDLPRPDLRARCRDRRRSVRR
jgi:histidinol-phosphate/aromatic aminotransferase/cobyric acid decarboxylase-like protein